MSIYLEDNGRFGIVFSLDKKSGFDTVSMRRAI